MKSLIFGLLATTVGMGSSVLNHGEYFGRKPFLVTTYYQTHIGFYDVNYPTDQICTAESIYPCTITYIIDPGLWNFFYSNRPTTLRLESLAKGTYEL